MLQEAVDALYRQRPPGPPGPRARATGRCSRSVGHAEGQAGPLPPRPRSASASTTRAARSSSPGRPLEAAPVRPAAAEMALELFKPFVMKPTSVDREVRRTTSRRAKTHGRTRPRRRSGTSWKRSSQTIPCSSTAPRRLHRLGIQAFEPVPKSRARRSRSTRSSVTLYNADFRAATRWAGHLPLPAPRRRPRPAFSCSRPTTSSRRPPGAPLADARPRTWSRAYTI